MRIFASSLCLVCFTAIPTATLAWQTESGGSEPAVPLYGNLGPHSRPITTTSDMAQAYFNEGLQFMYAFGPSSAVRSFREAQKHDPNCAMCFWGEAWALSPYLNGRMNLESESKAYAAIQVARDLSERRASEVERALIEAFTVRYAESPTEEMRRPLDTLYARAMRRVAEAHPGDLDAQTLYGESLMLLRPRRGSVDLDDPSVKEILPVLEGVLEQNIRHPGACHLYVHLVEASPEPGRAEVCADYLGDAIPGASHVRHMPSHIYMNIGRYSDDAVRASQNAWHVDQQAAYGGPPGIYPSHNLHMLLFAATLDGQSAVAIQAAKDLAKVARRSAFYYPVVLATFGRWDEVLQLGETPDDPFHEAMWRFARGMAHLRTGESESAKSDLQALRAIIDDRPESSQFRGHSQATLLGIPAGILEAELAASGGRHVDAVRILQQTIQLEDGLTYDEPEPWHLPARNVLGAILLEMDQAIEAERIYREALVDHPKNGWSLFGLEQALRAQGKELDADQARADYERYWARRDIWLRSSRF